MVYSVTQNNSDSWFGQLDRRIRNLENNTLQRLITVLPSGQVHINGQLSVGGGSEGGGGGGATVLVSGDPANVGTVTGAAGADTDSVWIDLSWVYPTDLFVPVDFFDVRYKLTTDAATEYQYLQVRGVEIRIDNLKPFGGGTLAAPVAYNFDVRSVGTNGRPGTWVARTAGTGSPGGDSGAPTAPGAITISADGNTTMMASWAPGDSPQVRDFAYYELNVATNSTQVPVTTGAFTTGLVVTARQSASNLIVIDSLDATGVLTYYWQVRAVDTSGNASAWTTNATGATTTLVPNAHIGSVAASKITTGSIASAVIDLASGGTYSVFKSDNFNGGNATDYSDLITYPGTTGFAMNGNGELVMNSSVFRGKIVASEIELGSGAGTLNVDVNGNMWWGASTTFAGATVKISNIGDADLANIDMSGSITMSGTIQHSTGASITLANQGAGTPGEGGEILFEASASGAKDMSIDSHYASLFGSSSRDWMRVVNNTDAKAVMSLSVTNQGQYMVIGPDATNAFQMQMRQSATGTNNCMLVANTDGSMAWANGYFSSNTQHVRFNQDGKMYLYNLSASTSGTDVRYDASTGLLFHVTSSAEDKTAVLSMGGVLDALGKRSPLYSAAFEPKLFRRNIPSGRDDWEAGFIAEELEAVMPEMVTVDGDGEVAGFDSSLMLAHVVYELRELREELDEVWGIVDPSRVALPVAGPSGDEVAKLAMYKAKLVALGPAPLEDTAGGEALSEWIAERDLIPSEMRAAFPIDV